MENLCEIINDIASLYKRTHLLMFDNNIYEEMYSTSNFTYLLKAELQENIEASKLFNEPYKQYK